MVSLDKIHQENLSEKLTKMSICHSGFWTILQNMKWFRGKPTDGVLTSYLKWTSDAKRAGNEGNSYGVWQKDLSTFAVMCH